MPRRRDAFQVAALGAAVIIAVQLTVSHWFYLYIVWFAPLALVALMAPWRRHRTRARRRPCPREGGRGRGRPAGARASR